MKKTILEIYALAVCFATIVCATVALGIALWDVVQVTAPEFTINNYSFERYQDNDSFRSSDCAADPARKAAEAAAAAASGTATATAASNNGKCGYSDAELDAKRVQEWTKQLNSEKRQGFQSLVRCLIVILLDLLVFSAHWILARRARLTSV